MTRAFLGLSGVVECRLCRAARINRLLRVKATVKVSVSGFLWFDGRQQWKNRQNKGRTLSFLGSKGNIGHTFLPKTTGTVSLFIREL
jgi:hypothetical protein